jgi:predicted nucleic acid-binding protein
MIVVSNTSPLIALAKTEHLFILQALFEQVLVPSIVAEEFLYNCPENEKQAFQSCTNSFLKMIEVTTYHKLTRTLDAGEHAVLGLALQHHLEIVLIDDRKAVNEAKEQGLLPISTRALLQVAERRGVIKDSHALESRLREKRFFLPNY